MPRIGKDYGFVAQRTDGSAQAVGYFPPTFEGREVSVPLLITGEDAAALHLLPDGAWQVTELLKRGDVSLTANLYDM